MANKEFFARHGLVVNNSVLVANNITGNIGIGTSSPAYKFDVVGSANISLPTLFVGGTNVLAAINAGNSYAASLVSSPKVNIANTPPAGSLAGTLWWNSDYGKLFIYYTDADSSQWVEASPTAGQTAGGTGTGSDPAAFAQANLAYDQANIAFNKANSANVLAFQTGIGANNWTNTVQGYTNSYAVSIGSSSNLWANTVSGYSNVWANTVAGISNVWANTVAGRSNVWANTVAGYSNTWANTLAAAGNGYTNLAFFTANIANAMANNIAADTDMKGFLNQTETYLRFDTTSNTFTLADSGAGWSYYVDGRRYTLSGNSTVVLGAPATNGTYYISIQNNGTGALSASNTAWDLSDPNNISVAYVKYNTTTTPKYFIAEERHTVLMDSRTHRYLHFTRGTQAQQFGLLSGYTVNGTANSNNIFSITTTILNDEDIIITIPAKTATAGNSNNYFVFSRYAANSWQWEQSEVPYPAAAAGFIQYDNSATLTQVANNTYVNSYLIFTNLDQGAGFAIIPGRATYANLTSAQAEDATAFDMTGFGVLESVVAYQFTWKTDDTLTTKGKCQLSDAPRRIGTAIASVAPVYTSGLHNDFGGLQGGTTSEYYHLTESEYADLQAGTIGVSANNWANTKLSNTSGVSFAGNLFFPVGNIAIGTSSSNYPLTIVSGGVSPLSGLTGALATAEGTINGTNQFNLRNAGTGSAASSDYIATSNDGTETTNFIDLGINNSGYNAPAFWTINGPRDGYLYMPDGNLSIGIANTTATYKFVNFFVGGALAADEVMRIQDSSGGANVGIGRTNPAYKLDVVGTVNATNVLINQTPVLANAVTSTFTGTSNNTLFVSSANSQEVITTAITYVIDGGGSAITTGQKGHLEIPFSATINQWTMMLDQTGSANVEIWKAPYVAFPPVAANTINAAGFVVTSGVKGQGTVIGTTTINAGDILAYNVATVSTATRLTISLKVTKV